MRRKENPNIKLFEKKKKLRPLNKLKDDADKTLQNYFRRIKVSCELCGHQYQVAHHYIPKKLSSYLRYDERNLVFVCNSCHSKFHVHIDPMLPFKVKSLRESDWEKYIEEHRHLFHRFNREELENIIKKYELL